MKKVVVLALDGVLDSSLSITLDTLRTAHSFAERARRSGGLQIVAAGYRRTIRTRGGLRLDVDATLKELSGSRNRADWLVVPGIGLTFPSEIVRRFQEKDARAAIELLRSGSVSRRVAAGCSAVFLLAESGLLDGRHATTTWWLAKSFRERYPEVRLDETRMVVRDEPYLTAGSAFAQVDLSLAIITELLGASVAELCSRYLVIEQRPSQARYMIQSHIQHVDPVVVEAERWIDANLDEPISISDLASAVAVSPKTLARRIESAAGISPVKFVQRRRLFHAAHLIETTSMTIDSIAERVGYQDGTALRKIVKRELGVAPGALRKRSEN